MKRFIALQVALVLATGCAAPRPPEESAVGRRKTPQGEVSFIPTRELEVSGLLDEGLTYFAGGRMFDAEARFRQALYLSPSAKAVKFNLALALQRQGLYEEAEGLFQNLLSADPQSIDYISGLAELYYTAGRRTEGTTTYKKAFELAKAAKNEERASSIARSISVVAYEDGREQESLCYSYEAYARNSAAAEAFAHTRLLLAMNLYETAASWLKKMMEEDKKLNADAGILYVLGLAQFALGDADDAEKTLERGLDYATKTPELAAELSAAHFLISSLKPPPEDLTETELEELEKTKESAIEFGETRSKPVPYWPPRLLSLLDELVSQAAEEA